MLDLNAETRITVEDAIKHEFFDSVREEHPVPDNTNSILDLWPTQITLVDLLVQQYSIIPTLAKNNTFTFYFIHYTIFILYWKDIEEFLLNSFLNSK